MSAVLHVRALSRWIAAVALPLCIAGAQAKATPEAVERLLAELDAAFEQGDVDGYLARFEPDHRGAVAIVGRHLERLVAASERRRRTSSILAGPTQVGDRSLVRVRHEVELDVGAAAPTKLVEDTYLTVRVQDRAVVPTFAVEMLPEMDCVQANKFKCPPCNYEIGGVDGFLCVPLRPQKSLALEAASFYLLGTDVVCDVHVQVESTPQEAAVAARKLAEAFAAVEPTAEVGLVTAWLPPMHAATPPAGMGSARVEVKLPQDDPGQDGGRAVLHVVTLGGLQHVLMVRGSTASLDRHRARLDELFRSYMLLEVDRDLVAAASEPLFHHTGGRFEGARYDNAIYGVTFTGPDGWRTEHRVGGARFRVRWTGPGDSRLWLVGHGAPAGVPAWTKPLADRWIAHHCQRSGYEPVDEPAERWIACGEGAWVRSCVLRNKRPSSPTAPRRRLLHVQLHEDLLLIVDGYGADEDAERTVRSTLGSLKRAP